MNNESASDRKALSPSAIAIGRPCAYARVVRTPAASREGDPGFCSTRIPLISLIVHPVTPIAWSPENCLCPLFL